jgi:hypothetical protein
MASALLAGGLANLLSNPLWIARTRLMGQIFHPEREGQTTLSGVLK